jgi:hypothetical protein
MDRIRITGGNELRGIIPISGAKNAALPLMIASLLTDDTLTLENVPHLADVEQLIRILGNHGADISVNGRRERQGEGYSRTIHFTSRNIVDTTAPYELVSKMRASFWVIGPLLAREGKARVSLPGGCAIGTRPVDLFIEGLRALGAEIEIDSGYINATAPKGGLVGARYVFPKVSVGATHVMMMAATLANGTTVIGNAAREPEVVDLANCLNAMGAKITGAGTATITIEGVTSLSGARHRVLPDRIETGTYAMAVAMTGAPFSRSTPSILAVCPERVIFAPSRASSCTCMKRFSKMVSVIWETPLDLVIRPMNCACRSVGKPGKGSVTTSTGRMPPPLRTTRRPVSVSVISAPARRIASSAVSSSVAFVPSSTTSPPVMATAMA